MLKFKTSCAVLAYLSSNLLNEVGLSLFRYFEVGLRVCDIVVKKFTFAISSPDEFLFFKPVHTSNNIEAEFDIVAKTVAMSNEFFVEILSFRQSRTLLRQCCFDIVAGMDRALVRPLIIMRCVRCSKTR